MNKDELIEIIARAVEDLLKDSDGSLNGVCKKKRALIIKNEECQNGYVFQCDELSAMWDFDVFPQKGKIFDLDEYDRIIITNLDSSSIYKLTEGNFEGAYLRLIGKCILKGKEAYIVEEQLESFMYRNSGPRVLLRKLDQRVETLKSWGLQIKSEKKLKAEMTRDQLSEMQIEFPGKRVVTQSDIEIAIEKGKRKLAISDKAMITDIAKELIEKEKIEIQIVEDKMLW